MSEIKIKKAHEIKVVSEIIEYEGQFGWTPKLITPIPKGNRTEFIITLEKQAQIL